MGTQKNEYLSDDYININNIISGFRNTNLKVEENNVTKAFIEENIDLYERNYLDKVINLAKDICKLNNITHKKNLVLTPEEIELSMVLLKRDF
jgi:hypothetical protein